MRFRLFVFVVFAAVSAVTAQPLVPTCRPVGRAQLLPNVPEASGLALSRRAPGTLWTLNDSGKPMLFRFDSAGKGLGVTTPGADLNDWEDLAVGPCPAGDCLYIADIGDNRRSRKQIIVYRTPEPAAGASTTADVESFPAAYPDAPHDAEALLTTANELFVITKEVPPRLYRFPTPLQAGRRAALQFVRALPERIRITGAAASADGHWMALRSNATLLLYRDNALITGGNPVRIDLSSLKEPQGEGVAFGGDDAIYLVSEAAEGGTAGVVTRLNCALPK